jgi:tRNA (cmo5U34)-methyltransferase
MSLNKNMTDIRYSKDIEEDTLFWQVVPHYSDAQNTITQVIQKEFGGRTQTDVQILEIGCGTGLTTEKILTADPRIVLTAIDNVDYIAEEARKRFAEQGATNLTILCADALEYLKQCAEGSFDAVVSALVLHNCTEEYRNQVFREVFRVLKKDGLFINADKYAQDDEVEHAQALKWQLEEFKKFDALGRPDLKDKWTQHYLDDEKPGILLHEKEYVDRLRALGFSGLEKVFRFQMEAVYVAKK